MSKKIMLLAMAVTALAFAAPSGAMATETNWSMEGLEESSKFEFETNGSMKIGGLFGGIECQETSTFTANDGALPLSTGIVHTHIDEPTTSCVGTGATFGGCQVKEIENTVEGSSVTFLYHLLNIEGIRHTVITNVEYSAVLEGKTCLDNEKTVTFKAKELEAIPNNFESISSLELFGEGTVIVGKESAPATLSGESEVLGEASGTYGLL